MDPRFKLLSLAVVSVTCLRGGFVALAALSLWAALLILAAGRPRLFLPAPRFVLLLAAAMVAVGALTTAGEPLIAEIPLTVVGILHGLRLSWRLLLLMVWGGLFAGTTRASELQDAVRWLLRPLPVAGRERVATMIGLVARFVPLMLAQAAAAGAAHRARCGDMRNNPFSRLSSVALNLLRRTLVRADDISMAMEARCYSETTSRRVSLKSCRRDWVYLSAATALCAALAVIGL
jgi:energy-coupling factor transporter transmembrane protein EcfT